MTPEQGAQRQLVGRMLGPYPIVALLGAGGMGEVYRAQDPRLGREVAIKVLPPRLSANPDALARFEREARAVAALSHPNILSIHDFGTDGGVAYAVMELLDGETLRGRLTRAPIAWQKAAALAVQVADGLAAAHAKGIVHRDLKPENIFLTTSGQLKILDFGLARVVSSRAEATGGANATRSNVEAVTQPGTVLGTVGYMSPEQVRGEESGPASDIFSFGCLLHEMLTGRGPFERGTPAEALAAVLRDDPPPLTGVDVPPALEALVAHCLEKRAQDRFHSASDMGFALRALLGPAKGLSSSGSTVAPTIAVTETEARSRGTSRPVAAGMAIGLIAGTIGTAMVARLFTPDPVDIEPVHLSLTLPPGGPLAPNDSPSAGSSIAISRDGRSVAFVAIRDGQRRLVLRSLGSPEERVLPGTEGALTPVFSPDGQWLAFFTETSLRKIPLVGGAPTSLCDTPPVPRGAVWADDGRIYYSPDFARGLQSVASSGGQPLEVTKVDLAGGESNHLLPATLPQGRGVLFTVWKGGDFGAASIWALSTSTAERRLLLESASAPRYIAPGFLVFSRGGGLFVIRFDPERLAVTGEAVPVVDGVWNDRATGTMHYAVSDNGTLVYALGGNTVERRQLVWVDRHGGKQALSVEPNFFGNARLSPDGGRIAVEVLNDVWVFAVDDRTLTRVTSRGCNQHPAWSPDGRHLAFSSSQDSAGSVLFWADIQSAGPPQRLTRDAGIQFPSSWTPDGQLLAYSAILSPEDTQTGLDIWGIRPSGDRPAESLVRTPFKDDQGMFSPDGRALAYVSDETGDLQVYLRSFPAAAQRIRVSADGGSEPVWARSGRELFYRKGREYYSVPVSTGSDSLRAGAPSLMFTGDFVVASLIPGFPSYDVTPDGLRFIMVARADDTPRPTRLEVVLGWTQELERRLQLVAPRQ